MSIDIYEINAGSGTSRGNAVVLLPGLNEYKSLGGNIANIPIADIDDKYEDKFDDYVVE